MKLKRLFLSLFLALAFAGMTREVSAATTLSTTTCPGAGCFNKDVDGFGSVGVQVTGTFVGTLSFEQTIDGTNFTTWAVFPNGSTSSVTSTTTTGMWSGAVIAKQIRVRFSAYTSGSAVVSIVGTQARGGGGNGALPTDATLQTSDVTTNNVTAAKHGFAPKLSGNAYDSFLGDGTYGHVFARGTITSNDPFKFTMTTNAAATNFRGVEIAMGYIDPPAGDTRMFSVLGGSAGTTCFLKVGYLNGSCYVSIGQSGETTTGTLHVTSNLDTTGQVASGTFVSAKAGSSTATMKAGGIICDTDNANCSCTTFTSSGVQNQWDVIQCTIPASALATNGDTLDIVIPWITAANANSKSYQAYWGGGTCSGSSAAMCASGTQIFSLATSNSGAQEVHRFQVSRTSSGNQRILAVTNVDTSTQDTTVKTASVTDTGAIVFAFGCRNTAAAAACGGTVLPTMKIRYAGM